MPICSVSSWTAAATLNYFELINYIELALQCLIRFLLPNCMNYCNLYLEYISRIQLTVYYEGILFNSGKQKSHHFVVIKSIQIKHSDVAVMICCSPLHKLPSLVESIGTWYQMEQILGAAYHWSFAPHDLQFQPLLVSPRLSYVHAHPSFLLFIVPDIDDNDLLISVHICSDLSVRLVINVLVSAPLSLTGLQSDFHRIIFSQETLRTDASASCRQRHS